jgi:hypothetical protein
MFFFEHHLRPSHGFLLSIVMTSVSFAPLYNEVVALSRASSVQPPLEENPTETLCARVKKAQEKLRDELLENIPSIVRVAATQGRSVADVLTFSGNEKYDAEFSYLFLLKGPRDREQKYDLYRHGFVPLFDTLMGDVPPFQLLFSWLPGCNLNKLTVEWTI